MPCCCDFDAPPPPPRYANKTMNENKTIENLRNELMTLGKKYNDLKGEDDKVTQLLCYTCGTLVDRDNMSGLDERLIKWWKNHNAWDKHRTLEMFKKEFGMNPMQRPTKDSVHKWFIRQAEDVHPLSDYHKNEFFNWVWDEFVAWFDGRKNRANRISELEAELARLKAES